MLPELPQTTESFRHLSVDNMIVPYPTKAHDVFRWNCASAESAAASIRNTHKVHSAPSYRQTDYPHGPTGHNAASFPRLRS